MNVLNYDKQMELKKKRLAPIAAFVATNCKVGREHRITAGNIYLSYQDFCKSCDFKPLSNYEFYTRLDAIPEVIKVSGKSGQMFLGIALIDEPERFTLRAQVLARMLELEYSDRSVGCLQEKLKIQTSIANGEALRIAKLQSFLNNAKSGDSFWVASEATLKDQLEVAERLEQKALEQAEALRELLRARGEVPD